MKSLNKPVIKIGLLGLGTVGTGTTQILTNNGADITAKVGSKLQITKALVRDVSKPRPNMDPSILLTQDPADVLADPEIDIVVEVMGGIEPAREYIAAALAGGKY